MKLTDEQQAICAAVARGDNVMVKALAGCAKSTTIATAVSGLPPSKSVCILAFNKKIKEEMQARVPPHIKVMTLNGLGHFAIQNSLRRQPIVNQDKLFELGKEVGLKRGDLSDCLALVRSARMAGILPRGSQGRALKEDSDENWADLCVDLDIDTIFTTPARTILQRSIALAMQGTIDFDDQLYISTLLFGSYPRFDLVLVDEAQDLSPFNHIQLAKAARGQIGAVGDPNQAIYAWRGADHESMESLRELRQEWTDLTLSMTFRCAKSVVRRQQAFVPEFRAHEDNLEGTISHLPSWRPERGTAVLCRNNAPLLGLAFSALRKHIPVNYLGRDIGANLKRLYNKCSNNGQLSAETTIANAYALLKEKPEKIDAVECLDVILRSFSSVDEAMNFLGTPKKDAVTLATGHKAKGLEWSTVYHLNPHLIPSKWVMEMEEESPKYEAALRQENNLRYVIETRTRDKLHFVHSRDFT